MCLSVISLTDLAASAYTTTSPYTTASPMAYSSTAAFWKAFKLLTEAWRTPNVVEFLTWFMSSYIVSVSLSVLPV